MSVGTVTIGVPAGGTSRTTVVIPSVHVCQLAKSLTFATARSFVAPTPDNKAALADLLTKLRIGGTQNRLLISGHTDLVGGRTANQQLSERRTQGVQAVLQGDPTGTATWDTLFSSEGWGDPELTVMATEVGEPDISRFRGAANRTARLDLFRRYFDRLLGGSTVPPITATVPPLLGCGLDQPLHGSRAAPSRDTTLPPITGEFGPNRRSEFFFFDSAATPITCSEYPNWTIACSLTPPAPTVTVTIAPIDTVRTGGTIDVQVTVNPDPLPFGTQVNLTLSNTSGTGEARFASNNGSTLTITGSGPVTIRGVTASSVVDNINLSATVVGQAAVLAQESFTVVAAISIFLQFEVLNLTTGVFEPLPAGINVDLMDEDPASNDRIATRSTEAGGRVFFNLTDLTPSGETNPDIFFLVHTNGTSHAGHTLPNEWSTNGWRATDGTAGLQPNFTGPSMGTPTTPIIFRIGLDFHVEVKYHVDAGARFGSDDPAPKGVLVRLMQERTGPDLVLGGGTDFRTNDRGRVSAVVFDAEPGSNFYIRVVFEIVDSSINLLTTRFSTVPLRPPILDVITPAGPTMVWDSNDSDADTNIVALHRDTSIGSVASPRLFLCSVADRNVALHILKVLAEEGAFFFQMTNGDWGGVEVVVTPTAPVTAFSWPVGRIQLKFPDDRWDRETVAHEMGHQIMWDRVGISSAGVVYEASLGDLVLSHRSDLLANPLQALIEGWAEFVEAVFEGSGTPPFSVAAPVDSSGTAVPGGLGPPPNNRGESVEGAFANGLWAIFQNHVVTSAVSANAHVPESANGDILTTTAAAYLRSAAVKDRFLSMIWNPLKALRPLSTQNSTVMINNIRTRNLTTWHALQPELQAFNMAMTPPTVTAISPRAGLTAGGQIVTLTGDNFVLGTTTVEIGGVATTAVTVTSSTSLTATTGARAAGRVDVVVTTPAGSATLPGSFIYADVLLRISDVQPRSGPVSGGTRLTITGAGFQPGATVFVGTLAATGVTLISAIEIEADTPAGSAGLEDVSVVIPDGQTDTVTDGFLYVPSPQIVDVQPRSGPAAGGTLITITGSNFQAGVGVLIGGRPALGVIVVSPTEITAATPTLPLPAVPGPVDVQVENPDGQTDTVTDGFTYTP